jgi:hypothetical protein
MNVTEKLNHIDKLRHEILQYFEAEDDFSYAIIEDHTDCFWVIDDTSIWWDYERIHDNEDEDPGSYRENIYYNKVFRQDKYTMIVIDFSRTEIILRIFDNEKEYKKDERMEQHEKIKEFMDITCAMVEGDCWAGPSPYEIISISHSHKEAIIKNKETNRRYSIKFEELERD